jgi:omega-6 fatty acid desaturase (delta-12 desaturase)
VSAPADLEQLKRSIIERHVRPSNLKAALLVLTTLLPLAALWYAVMLSAPVSLALTAALVFLMSLFLLRAFVLMHECGHGSLFRSARLNRIFGFIFGVVTGMPQFVWSAHHQFHHSTNGNWARYQGPLAIVAVEKYAAMSASAQRRYRNSRNIWRAPHAGLFYLLITPRCVWLQGSFKWLLHVLRRPRGLSMRAAAAAFKTPHWESAREYRHLFTTSMTLFAAWALMAWLAGPLVFALCYAASIAIAGWAGILIFTVQHNFEHSYASGDAGWNYHDAAIGGTSFLVLPRWLNWFTVNIGYHHIHHLSARIPAYCLVACHDENRVLFADVKRLGLAQIPHALKFILWDPAARRLVSVAEFERQAAAA